MIVSTQISKEHTQARSIQKNHRSDSKIWRTKREERREKRVMGYVLRVKLASFFAGAATASFIGLYLLHEDYKVAHHSISQQMKGLHESLDGRISSLEKLKEIEASKPMEAD